MRYFFIFNPDFWRNLFALIKAVLLPLIELINFIINRKKKED